MPEFDEVNAFTPKNSRVKQFERSASDIRLRCFFQNEPPHLLFLKARLYGFARIALKSYKRQEVCINRSVENDRRSISPDLPTVHSE
jgi:hypothetical protein